VEPLLLGCLEVNDDSEMGSYGLPALLAEVEGKVGHLGSQQSQYPVVFLQMPQRKQ